MRLADDGGTANGGVDTSAPQTFTITVTPVNDAPSFTKGADQTVNEDAAGADRDRVGDGHQRGAGERERPERPVPSSAPTIRRCSRPGRRSQPDGTLTYTPAADANGTATVTIYAQDNGGTANGGVDTSAPQTFAINVTAVNDAPTFTKGADQTVLEDSGAQTVSGWATAISAGPANESGQALTFSTHEQQHRAVLGAAGGGAQRHADLHAGGRTRSARRR